MVKPKIEAAKRPRPKKIKARSPAKGFIAKAARKQTLTGI
jgi:hypothetical protein